MMVAEQDDHFSLRGHIGAPLNALYEVRPLASPRVPHPSPLAPRAHHRGGSLFRRPRAQIKCCYPRSECEAQPNLPCAMAPVPTDGVLNQACWDPDPEPEPEPDPEPYGRMLFEADGFAEGRHEMSHDGHADGHAELDRFACTDTPDELLAPQVELLGLPAESCPGLLAEGACELETVKRLCAKACSACGNKGRSLSPFGKCMARALSTAG